jgi:urea carboxylase
MGCRSYMAISGGINAPLYLGSRSTFPKGGFGGWQGRPLEAGDVLPLGSPVGRPSAPLAEDEIPIYTDHWELAALVGPHGAPDYFTPEDVELFFAAEWEVSLNSSRLGYRLEGPTVQFARDGGGEGGSHPSNLIDYSYGIGAVNFTGTTPVILTADGPSLGGFVCMATVASAEMWKVGQARPGDKVRFVGIDLDGAEEIRSRQEDWLNKS